jgi:formate dehydrogenase
MAKCSETKTFNLLQLRYAAGVKDMLERYFKGHDFPEPNYIVKEGKLASQYQ